MPETVQRLTEEDWVILMDNLRRKSCTPFLGPEMVVDGLQQRRDVAQTMAQRWAYPDHQWEYLDDPNDLARVGRFVSVRFSADFARSKYFEEYSSLPIPDFKNAADAHVGLASLPIPIFVTTNHNDFMMRALKAAEKDPHQEVCRWKSNISDECGFLAQGKEPTAAQPVVFQFYGSSQTIAGESVLESLVFTEDDYFEFLINVARDEDKIPLRIQRAMAGTSLLLLGYRMDEWDFRVLFHYLLARPLQMSRGRTHVAVQVPSDEAKPEEQRKKVQEFLNRYIASKRLDIRVYWGSSQEFVAELKKRW